MSAIGENSGARTHVKYTLTRANVPFHRHQAKPVAACVPLPQAIPGCIVEPQTTFRSGIVAPFRDQIEPLTDRERLPLILCKTNPITIFLFLYRGLEIGELPEQDLLIASGPKKARNACGSSVIPVAPASQSSATSRSRSLLRLEK